MRDPRVEVFKNALNDVGEIRNEARLSSWALKDSECCANCKNAKKAHDRYNKDCVACGLNNKIVRYNDYCSNFNKPFLGQSSDKRMELIQRDLIYTRYHR